MLGIIAAVAQVYYFLHESAVCRFRATVVFSVYPKSVIRKSFMSFSNDRH